MAIQVVIPGYDSLEQIGVGGMAAVYKARKVSIDKVVAIKLLFPYLASDNSFIDRFQREARAAASVQHENIVNVIDYGESDGSYYIVMEYYNGETLEDLLKSQASLPLDVAVSILLEVCYGLEAAHERNIVHRDIKPGNVIYTKSGGIKIADFGLAKKSDGATMITQAGKVVGTPAYMSPEQAAGQNVGPQSDVFSLGVVAYELLGQSRPFDGASYSEVLEAIQTKEPLPLTSANPLIQPHFADIVARMLEKDPDRRYPSITAVIHDLEEAMDEYEITRDRRRLSRFSAEPEEYTRKFREKTIARCISQGTYFMKKGQGHIDEAILEFRRILYLDPQNERARKHLSRLLAERGKDTTVSIDARDPAQTNDSSEKTPSKRVRVVAASKTTKRVSRGRHAAGVAFLAVALLVAGFFGYREGYFELPETTRTAPERTTTAGAFEADIPVPTPAPAMPVQPTPKPSEITFDPVRDARMETGQRVTRTLSATSTSGGDVSFRLASSPAGMTLSGDRLEWQPSEPGTYEATIVASDGTAEARRVIRVTVSEPAPEPVAQPTGPGTVEWKLPKSATIYVDGKLVKRNTRSVSLELAAGPHTFIAELPSGVIGWNEVVDVRAGETTTRKAPELTYGTLSVYFLGGVGEFQINGKRFGEQPPFSGARLPVGTHTVSCRFSTDTDAHDLSIQIEEGRETVIEYEPGKDPVVTVEK